MTAAYGSDGRGARTFQASQRGDNARRFRAAMRHSRRVRLLRIGLPAAVVIGIIGIALVSWFNPLRMLARLPISIGDVVVSGTKIKMESPKLSGFTRDSRRYDFTAGAAAQDLTRPGVIELQDVTAVVEMENNAAMNLSATTGVFDTKKERLVLERNIVVTSSNGYEGFLDQAEIDTRTGNVVSERPVFLKMLNGTVKSNRFEMVESGDLIRFDRGVVVNMRLDENQNRASQPAAPR